MNKHLMKSILGILILVVIGCKDPIPGRIKISLVEHISHNSVVIQTEIFDVGKGVGLQFRGICAHKTRTPVFGDLTFKGVYENESGVLFLTGVSGLEPNTPYILRAYCETNEGIVYSDTVVVKTLSVDWMTDSRDGKKYQVKSYGNQVWMVQNLDYPTPGSLVFENNPGKYPSEFGKLYTSQEAVNACPSGWRLPSDEDWKTLEEFIGIPKDELDKTALRGSPAGGMMKEPGMRLWESESALHSNNKSGFSVVPSGWYRTDKKEFTYSKTCAGFWTVSEDSKTAFLRFFYVNSDGVSRTGMDPGSLQVSVRCIRN